ncbi:MAG: UDP-N-acetylmuramate dehydrogenase [Armatimonadetes bacterium]|nr:UDP-N-acetylmuramate dehydrogenase [Armatimonadota bacterium]
MSVVPFDLSRIERKKCLRPFTTLKAGGAAETFFVARTADELAEMAEYAQVHDWHATILGWGSNVLPSDDGVTGLVVLNRASEIHVAGREVLADAGCGFQDLFLKSAQAGLAGLEFAVGIPGTLGGALVSNAGAYRSNVSEFLKEIEIVFDGKRQWVEPAFMQFSYRDSVLRRLNPPQCVLLRVRFELPRGSTKAIYDEAREYQRQRISKQPPPASAGSFFKNVNDHELAQQIVNLPGKMKVAGVVPAGYLIEHAGLRGTRHGGAMIARKHANFILNVGSASATEVKQLAGLVRKRVFERFGVALEEEVLYLGDWTNFREAWERSAP